MEEFALHGSMIQAGESLGWAMISTWGLITLRCLGIFYTVPVLGEAVVPHRIRIVLAGLLGLVITPVIFPVRSSLEIHFASLAWSGMGEFLLGAGLGFSIRLLLSGLFLAASLLDRQSGLGLVQVVRPELQDWGTPSSQLFAVLGVLALLSGLPISADLKMMAALLESFQALPVGEVFSTDQPVRFLMDLMAQAIVLGMRVAAPSLILLGMVQAMAGFARRCQLPEVTTGTLLPLQLVLGLLALALTVEGALDQIHDSLVHISDLVFSTASSASFQGSS